MFTLRPSGAIEVLGTLAELLIEFAGVELIVDGRLSFGRSGDLSIDENRHLHRQVGEFFFDRGVWWLRNVGSRIHLLVLGSDGGRVELPPAAVVALTASRGTVQFSAGPTRYELGFALSDIHVPFSEAGAVTGESTIQPGLVLTPREVDFLVTFARARLEGIDAPLPTYAEVALLWGVALKTLDNTVQATKRKVKAIGLGKDLPLEAIVRVLVRQGFITQDDLAWSNLREGQPRSSAAGPRFTT